MELRNIREVIEDYDRAKFESMSSEYGVSLEDYTDIETYFDSTDSYAPLSNDHGQVACSEYIEFVSSTVFCPDGSWMGYQKDKASAQDLIDIKKLLMIANNHIRSSNFYTEITKLVKHGVFYNKGLIDTSWQNGLTFKSIKGNEIVCSKHTEPGCMRAYATKWLSKEEVILGFQSPYLDSTYSVEKMKANQLAERVQVVIGIVPANEIFFNKPNKRYSHKKVYILLDGAEQVEIMRDEPKENYLFKSFPVMSYSPHLSKPLAYSALASAVKLDMYEDLITRQARKILNPTTGMPESIIRNGSYDMDEGGIIPILQPHNLPVPIESKQQINVSFEDIRRLEAKIDRIFKIPLIERVGLTNLSQFEAAGNILAAFKAISPSAADLITRVPSVLLKRVDTLLSKHDREYRYLSKKLKGSLDMGGLQLNIKKMEKAVALGRIAQGLAPYLQAYPESKVVINGDHAVSGLVDSWNQQDILSTEEEVRTEREQIQQTEEQMMGTEQDLAQAQIQKLQNEGGQNV